ncbi:MAG: SCO family protein [Steroidobacteraceae bacterium]
MIRQGRNRWHRTLIPMAMAALTALAGIMPPARAQPPPDLAQAAWQQRLGRQLPLQLRYVDEHGRVAPLASYFGRRPVALILMYLSCSQLCPLTMRLTQQAFQKAGLIPGRDVELLAVSIDPWDRPAAALRRQAQLAGSGPWRAGLHILTAVPGTDPSATLAAAVGFGYLYDPHSRQYGHPAGWVLVDAHGRINRYFFGLQYDAATLRGAVRNAAGGGRPTWSQPLRLLCYCLVALAGRYDGRILDILRFICIGVVLLGGWFMWRGLRRPASPS